MALVLGRAQAATLPASAIAAAHVPTNVLIPDFCTHR